VVAGYLGTLGLMKIPAELVCPICATPLKGPLFKTTSLFKTSRIQCMNCGALLRTNGPMLNWGTSLVWLLLSAWLLSFVLASHLSWIAFFALEVGAYLLVVILGALLLRISPYPNQLPPV
jgi:hypothetical protein